MSSLLEEAIVDAKALKEAALKNAETAVLEKYSGEVRTALDTLLEQEEDNSLEEVDTDELMEFTKEVPFAFENEEIDGPDSEEIIEIDFDALKQRLEEEDETVESDDMIDATALADDIALQEDGDMEQMMKDEDDAEESTAVASSGGGSAGMPLEEDEDIALTEEMLAALIEELVVDMTPRPQGWSSLNSADNSVEQANNDAMADALAAHLEDDEEEEAAVSTAPDVVSDAPLFESKISKLTDSNRELHALVMEAKDQLTKLNLDNAKLVYQNKALNSASLNERQKKQIVEAIQTANSVEETSMIFETIQNAVGTTPDQRNRPQTLREAVQRPTSLLMNSKRNNEATTDPNMVRMLRLAGLNK